MNYVMPALVALFLVPQLVFGDIVAPPGETPTFAEVSKLTLSIEVEGQPLQDQSASSLVPGQTFMFSYGIGYTSDWFFDPEGELSDEDRLSIFNEELERNASFLSLWSGRPLSPDGELLQLWDISGQPTGTLETNIPEGKGEDFFFLFDIPDYVLRDPEGACAEFGDPPEFCSPEVTLAGLSVEESLGYILSPTAMLDRGEDGVYVSRGFGGVRFTVASSTSGLASNILFLPGIQGSRLYEDVLGIENKRWELTPIMSQLDAHALYFNPDGTSKNDIYVKEGEVVAQVELPFTHFDVYRTFIEQLGELKGEGTIGDYVAFPYDWRMDPISVVEDGVMYKEGLRDLVSEVVSLAESSHTGKVTIVGHSNGGLVAKALTARLEREGLAHLIDTVMLVAVPQLGTPQTIIPMLHGDLGLLTSFGGLHLRKENARGLAEYMPDTYVLLPSSEYFRQVGDPVVDLTGAPILAEAAGLDPQITTLAEFSQFLTAREKPTSADVETPNVLSAALLATADDTHQVLDTWIAPEGVRTVEIAGWGIDTPKGVAYEEKEDQRCIFPGISCSSETRISHRALITSDGDGTVAGVSQLASEAETHVIDLRAFNKTSGSNWKHANILESEPFQELFAALVQGDEVSIEYVTPMPPATDGNRLRLRVLSPITLHAYDEEGRHTGPVELHGTDLLYMEEEIPNSYYAEFGEGKYLGMPAEGNMRVEMKGLGSGNFTYEIESVESDEVRTFTYRNLPVTPETVATMEIPDGGVDDAVLEIDTDGDGKIDLRPLPEEGNESARAYLATIQATLPTMGLPKYALRQMLAKFINVDHILKESGQWEMVDDDGELELVEGESVETRALRKIEQIELWIERDQNQPPPSPILRKSVGQGRMDPNDAEALLVMTAQLRFLTL